MKLKTAYFGTPDFSARFLEGLITNLSDKLDIQFVVTQPDKPIGRRQMLTSSPVKQLALQHDIPVYAPDNINDIKRSLSSVDFALLYAYGEMIPTDYLNSPKYGFINIHPSLLPRYRGASPIAFPIMMGEGETGISIMQMDRKLDHGPLLGQKSYKVSPTDTRKNLQEKLTALAFELFSEILPKFGKNFPSKNQAHEHATFSRKLTKNDGYVSASFIKKAYSNSPIITADLPLAAREYSKRYPASLPSKKPTAGEALFNLYRALHPWPGVWTKVTLNGIEKRLKLTKMTFDRSSSAFKLTRVQLEGKNEVEYKTFVRAYGEIFI